MTHIDLYLVSDTESDINNALISAGFTMEDGSETLRHPQSEVSVIGTIYRPTGEVVMADGAEVPVMAAAHGYHVNVRTTSQDVADKLESLRTHPVTPVRVWA